MCKNCNSAWQSWSSKLVQVDFEIVAGEGDFHLYLPFWKIKPEVTGLKVDSYADLAKLANLPWVPQNSWAERDVYFWVPAFRLPPALFVKFSKRMTLRQQEKELARDFSGIRFHPTNLSVHAVAAWLKVALFDMAVAKRRMFPQLNQIGVQILSFILAYVPFQRQAGELIEPSAKLSVSENALNR
jgi:hypothetical protein